MDWAAERIFKQLEESAATDKNRANYGLVRTKSNT